MSSSFVYRMSGTSGAGERREPRSATHDARDGGMANGANGGRIALGNGAHGVEQSALGALEFIDWHTKSLFRRRNDMLTRRFMSIA